MDEINSQPSLPRRPAFWLIIGIVAIVAFSLGVVLNSGGDSSPSSVISEDATVPKKSETWTCSMHPQIKLPKPGKCPICFMALVPLSTDGGLELGPRQLRMSESSKKLAQIETSPVIRGRASGELRLYGKLGIDEARLSKITARVAGRIDRLYVNTTGMVVRAGDKMVDIYSPDMLSAQQELVQAKASLASIAKSGSDILKSTAEATVLATQEKLRLLGFSDSQIAEVDSQSDATEHITIKAPIGGTVVEKMVVEGQYVEPGMELLSVADLSRLWVLMDAYESDLSRLGVGDPISFTTQSLPGEVFDAKITFINPTLDPMTRTVTVRAQIENSRGHLKPEMFVTAVVASATGEHQTSNEFSLLVPASAVLLTGKRAVVYVEIPNDDGPLFEGREVEVGARAGDQYVVLSGLSEDEMVVTNGAFKLDSELQIQAKPSMMSQEAAHIGETRENAYNQTDATTTKKAVLISAAARDALTPVYDDYFAFQMALAKDDLANARQAAAKLASTVSSVSMTLFSGSAHENWMHLSRELLAQTKAAASAADIDEARGVFFHLSKAILDLHGHFGHSAAMNYYLTFCPMARDNAGAYWLQTVDTVYNSFYGAAMLRCGEIKQALKAEN